MKSATPIKPLLMVTTLVMNQVIAPSSYGSEPTKLLDATGKVTQNNASCVTVSETGLTWELKTDNGGVHDKDNLYRWGGIGAEAGGKLFFDDWNTLVLASNEEILCGFTDWRLPTIDELRSLLNNKQADSEAGKSLIDNTLFPLNLDAPYWTVSNYKEYPEHARPLDFNTGASHYYQGFRGNGLPVRLVRGDKKSLQP